jgi:hypothetical protein
MMPRAVTSPHRTLRQIGLNRDRRSSAATSGTAAMAASQQRRDALPPTPLCNVDLKHSPIESNDTDGLKSSALSANCRRRARLLRLIRGGDTVRCACLFDHLVGDAQYSIWYCKAQSARGFEIDDEIELGRLFKRNVAGASFLARSYPPIRSRVNLVQRYLPRRT